MILQKYDRMEIFINDEIIIDLVDVHITDVIYLMIEKLKRI